ncbi:MAG TPA: hypothetical protein VIY08_08410 [Candidatus Nitrosocosmicus sp.]
MPVLSIAMIMYSSSNSLFLPSSFISIFSLFILLLQIVVKCGMEGTFPLA